MNWAYKENAVERYLEIRSTYFRVTGRFFEDWLDKLLVMGVITAEDWDRENGKYFNFPKCCIEWYIILQIVDIKAAEFMDDVWGQTDSNEYEYVRCPVCRHREE